MTLSPRSVVVVLSGLVLFGPSVGCNGSPKRNGENNPIEEPAIVRIEIRPGSVLLAHDGAPVRLTAVAHDVLGGTREVQATWTSSHPEAVTVSEDGTLTALVSAGSAKVTASVGELQSAPALVIVAQVAPEAVLLTDAQIASEVQPVEDTEPKRFTVLLRDVEPPAPGTILLSGESRPLAGRVVSAEPTSDGVLVTCETVQLHEAFVELRIDETLPLVPPEAPQGTVQPLEFAYGPFECEAKAMPKLSFSLPISLKLEPDVDADFQLELKNRSLTHLRAVITGTMAITASGALQTTAAFSAEIKCETEFRTIPIPVGGAIAFFIAPVVPLGAGFVADGSFELAQLKLGWEGKLGATVSVGLDYTSTNGLQRIASFEPIKQLDPVFEIPTSLTEDMRIKLGFQPYAFARLGIGTFPLIGGPRLDIFDGTVGPRAELDYATERAQVQDTNYASSYGIKIKARLGFAGDVTEALEFLGGALTVSPPDFTFELPLASSPNGTLSASAASVEVNKPVQLTVKLDDDSASFLGVHNVDQVTLYRVTGTSTLQKVTELLSTSGQLELKYTWTPKKSDEGDHRFVAFVRPSILGLSVLPQLEVSKDSSTHIYVHSPQQPAPTYAGRLTVFTHNSDCDLDSTPDYYMIYPNGTATLGQPAGLGDCYNGTQYYKAPTATWIGTGTHLQITRCCPEGLDTCDPHITALDWNPSTNRWEGTSDSVPASPHGPLQVCAYAEQVNFTGLCVAPACITMQLVCNGNNVDVPTILAGCATHGYCENNCSECSGGRPYYWEAGVTPDCF